MQISNLMTDCKLEIFNLSKRNNVARIKWKMRLSLNSYLVYSVLAWRSACLDDSCLKNRVYNVYITHIYEKMFRENSVHQSESQSQAFPQCLTIRRGTYVKLFVPFRYIRRSTSLYREIHGTIEGVEGLPLPLLLFRAPPQGGYPTLDSPVPVFQS
jgi:hypothetical protein